MFRLTFSIQADDGNVILISPSPSLNVGQRVVSNVVVFNSERNLGIGAGLLDVSAFCLSDVAMAVVPRNVSKLQASSYLRLSVD